MQEKALSYPGGLTAVVEYIPTVRSVAVGFWVGTGSRHEQKANNGISHFTEHMLFKGTDTMGAQDIANAFENYGAHINAFTGKEYTCYYFKSIDEYKADCFRLLSEIFFDSVFDPAELDRERKVIIEEINMVEDAPEDLCSDVIAAAAYGEAGLGRTILGSVKNVSRFTRADILSYMRANYLPQNTVISFAGNITSAEADKLIGRFVLPKFPAAPTQKSGTAQSENRRKYLARIKDFEQSNIALSWPSVKFADEKMPIQTVMNVIVGGGMSSRLFQSVRERQGLAYSVYSAPSGYTDCGNFNILLNITPANTQETLLSVKAELDKLKAGGITEAELTRARVQLKAALVFSQESVQGQMNALGKFMLNTGRIYDVDERIQEIDGVTLSAVNGLIRETFDYQKLNAAYVGKETGVDMLGLFA